MARQAEPLDPRALSVWHDACIEEINQRHEHWGLSCLLATHTGLRRRIVAHYTDQWRIEDTNGNEKISLPTGQTACTVNEDGCVHCNAERYSCDDGFFMVKKDTAGEGREIPVWENWMDYYRNESRPTQLPEMLDTYFRTNDSFGFAPNNFGQVVKKVAQRRHDILVKQHEGETTRWLFNKKETAPDLKPHDLRATWATQCLRTGIEDEQLMDWGGWSSREMIDRYRSKLNDPSGENTRRYAQGRSSEGMSAREKLAKLRDLGVIDKDENLSADELAEVVELLG